MDFRGNYSRVLALHDHETGEMVRAGQVPLEFDERPERGRVCSSRTNPPV